MAGTSPDIQSYTVHIYGSGQPYTLASPCTKLFREAALEEYKNTHGAEKAKLLLENRARLKELKRRAKVWLALRMNDVVER
jgi:hypothetical protein